jgi:plasmid maintenance system killer protein
MLGCTTAAAQFTVRGTVLDSTKTYPVKNVMVYGTNGSTAMTDSTGTYAITVNEKDSIWFYYNAKPTMKFPVRLIGDINSFDIAISVRVKSRFKQLKEVVVYSKNYRQDSLENRQTYASVFNYEKPGVKASLTPDGGVGADLDQLINIFRFRRNKQLRKFQMRLEAEEQEKYIDYRFNKRFVKRLTQLDSAQLETFMQLYRPTYAFASQADVLTFNQYIISAGYDFKLALLNKERN